MFPIQHSKKTTAATTSNGGTTNRYAGIIALLLALACPGPSQADDALTTDDLEIPANTLTAETLENLENAVIARRTAKALEDQSRQRALYEYAAGSALKPASDGLFSPDNRSKAESLRQACASGDQAACAELGTLYIDGKGTAPDLPLGFALNFFACEAGDDQGCAQIYQSPWVERGDHLGPYPEIAHFLNRCEDDYAPACRNLGTIFTYGFHPDAEKDEPRGLAYTQRACDLGDESACRSRAYRMPNAPEDRDGCDADDAVACYRLAQRHARGRDVPKDRGEAIRLYRKTCALAYGPGCAILAGMHDRGRGLPKDPALALSFFERACDVTPERAAPACVQAGKRRETGQGGEIDLRRALAHYRAACSAQKGHCQHFWRLGAEAFDAFEAKADELFHPDAKPGATAARQACAANDASGCTRLADLYLAEKDGERQAIGPHLLARACALGHATACLRAGELKRDHTSADLYRQACNGGLDAGCVAFGQQASAPAKDRIAALTDACENGGGQSCLFLAAVYARANILQQRSSGLAQDRDIAKAVRLLKRACFLRHADACTHLARETDGKSGNDYFDIEQQDPDTAKDLFHEGCQLGSAWGCSQVAYLFQYGIVFPKDLDRALLAARRACDIASHYCEAMTGIEVTLARRDLTREHGALDAALIDRMDGVRATHTGRVRRARDRCKSGDLSACVRLGRAYGVSSSGDDGAVEIYATEKTWSLALFQHACDNGLAAGCTAYGGAFHNVGDASDHGIAFSYFGRACEMGDGHACAEFGPDYEHGWHFDEHPGKSRAYYRLGCTYGSDYACGKLSEIAACLFHSAYACEALGRKYEHGRGDFPTDRAVAQDLYRIGCGHEDEESCSALADITDRL